MFQQKGPVPALVTNGIIQLIRCHSDFNFLAFFFE